MLIKTSCAQCAGSGVRIIQTSSLFGLKKRETPTTCEACNGTGEITSLPLCSLCDGRGLVGNESEICRACNGTGHIDNFALIPRDLLVQGTEFDRRCDRCGEHRFRIEQPLESVRINRSWEAEEALRDYETIERVGVRCVSCGNAYLIQVDEKLHRPLEESVVGQLEAMGLNLSFLFRSRPQQQGSLRA